MEKIHSAKTDNIQTTIPFDPKAKFDQTKDYYVEGLEEPMLAWFDDSKNSTIPVFFAETARFQAIINKKYGTAHQTFPTLLGWYFLRSALDNKKNAPFIDGGMTYYRGEEHIMGLGAIEFKVNAQKFVDLALRTTGLKKISSQRRMDALTCRSGILYTMMKHGLIDLSEITSSKFRTITVTFPSLITYIKERVLADLEPDSKEKRSILHGVKYIRRSNTRISKLFPGLWKLCRSKANSVKTEVSKATRSALVQIYLAKCNGGMDINPQWNKKEELKAALHKNDFRKAVDLLNEHPNHHNMPKALNTLASDLNLSISALKVTASDKNIKICKKIPVFKIIARNASGDDVMKARAAVCKYITEDYFDTGPLRVSPTAACKKAYRDNTEPEEGNWRYNIYVQQPNVYLLYGTYPTFYPCPELVPSSWYDKTMEEAKEEYESFQQQIDKCTGIRPVTAKEESNCTSLVTQLKPAGEDEYVEVNFEGKLTNDEDIPLSKIFSRKNPIDHGQMVDWTPEPYGPDYMLNPNFPERQKEDSLAREERILEQEKDGKEAIADLKGRLNGNPIMDNLSKDQLKRMEKSNTFRVEVEKLARRENPKRKRRIREEIKEEKERAQNRLIEKEQAEIANKNKAAFGANSPYYFNEFIIPQKAIDAFNGDRRRAGVALRNLEHKLLLAKQQENEKTAKKIIGELEKLGSCDPSRRYRQYFDGDKIVGIYLNHYGLAENNTSFAEYVVCQAAKHLEMSNKFKLACVEKDGKRYFPLIRGSTFEHGTKKWLYNRKKGGYLQDEPLSFYGRVGNRRYPLNSFLGELADEKDIAIPSRRKLINSWEKATAKNVNN